MNPINPARPARPARPVDDRPAWIVELQNEYQLLPQRPARPARPARRADDLPDWLVAIQGVLPPAAIPGDDRPAWLVEIQGPLQRPRRPRCITYAEVEFYRVELGKITMTHLGVTYTCNPATHKVVLANSQIGRRCVDYWASLEKYGEAINERENNWDL